MTYVLGLWLNGATVPIYAQHWQTGQLDIEIQGLRNQQGQVCLNLFTSSRGFPGNSQNAVQNQCVAVTTSSPRVTFDSIQAGSYAVAVLHDANGDREVNRNVLGIPQEGFGFSRNPVIRTGPPEFGDAMVVVAGPKTSIQVRLNYF